MDSVPRAPRPDQPTLMLASPVAAEAQEPSGEPADDPYSPGPQPLPYLLGVLIALATAVVPIATVLGGRSLEISPQALNGSTASPSSAASAGEIPRSQVPGTPGRDPQSQPH
jgi:hypothetical protein